MNERAKTILERVGCIHLGRHRRRGGEGALLACLHQDIWEHCGS